MSDFDNRYGDLREPVCHPFEGKFRQSTVAVLDGGTAAMLNEFMALINSNNKFIHTVVLQAFFLWVVSKDGDIYLSFEEIVEETKGNILFARSKNTGIRDFDIKLGHPALVKGGPARVGGEIYFDADYREWVITNQSGRFGYNRKNVDQLLINVADEFLKWGVALRPYAFTT